MLQNSVSFHAPDAVFDTNPLFAKVFVFFLLLCRQFVHLPLGCSLSLVRDVNLFSSVQIFKPLKAQVYSHAKPLEPSQMWRKLLFQQSIVVFFAFVRLADVQYPSFFVGDDQLFVRVTLFFPEYWSFWA